MKKKSRKGADTRAAVRRSKRKPEHQAMLRIIKVTLELQKQIQLLRLDVQRRNRDSERTQA